MTGTQTGPLRAVLEAFASGVTVRADVCRITGLPRDVVDAAIGHLVRVGRITAKPLSMGCSESACGGCVFASPRSAACSLIGRRPAEDARPLAR
jgi:hypothetical protein